MEQNLHTHWVQAYALKWKLKQKLLQTTPMLPIASTWASSIIDEWENKCLFNENSSENETGNCEKMFQLNLLEAKTFPTSRANNTL